VQFEKPTIDLGAGQQKRVECFPIVYLLNSIIDDFLNCLSLSLSFVRFREEMNHFTEIWLPLEFASRNNTDFCMLHKYFCVNIIRREQWFLRSSNFLFIDVTRERINLQH
jgi:hypothetical protein